MKLFCNYSLFAAIMSMVAVFLPFLKLEVEGRN